MATSTRPAAEHPIDDDLVAALLIDQHPDLAALPLREFSCGWDNVIYRLGDAHVVRLPRRAISAALVEGEQRWLPQLALRLPLPIPAPIRIGRPGRGYPWRWSICPWLEGESAADGACERSLAARDLAEFLSALHVAAPADAPTNQFRGGALSSRNEAFAERLHALRTRVDGPRLQRIWDEAIAAPRDPEQRMWIHGDLHPANLVVRDGRLAGVIDFGDLTGGDPATDLSVAWTFLDAASRPLFRETLGGVDDATWIRARGWALSHGLACLAHSSDDPRMARIGASTLREVVDDPEFPLPGGASREA